MGNDRDKMKQMKRKATSFFWQIIILIIFSSCANEKKGNITEPAKVDNNSFFSLKLRAIVKKDDLFELFYVQGENEIFSANYFVSTKVEGSELEQDIIFRIPLGDYPYNIKLDFGTNKEQGEVIILECILDYSKRKYRINGKELNKYFNFSEISQVPQDSTKYNISLSKNRYDPYMIGNDGFKEVLNSKI